MSTYTVRYSRDVHAWFVKGPESDGVGMWCFTEWGALRLAKRLSKRSTKRSTKPLTYTVRDGKVVS